MDETMEREGAREWAEPEPKLVEPPWDSYPNISRHRRAHPCLQLVSSSVASNCQDGTSLRHDSRVKNGVMTVVCVSVAIGEHAGAPPGVMGSGVDSEKLRECMKDNDGLVQ